MPILTLKQEITSLREGMNQIGVIRKGAPKKADRPGEDLPYFRIVLNEQYTHLQPVIDELFGARPEWFAGAHVIEDTAEKAFSFWMEEWGGGGTLYHRCDGKDQVQRYDGKGYSFAKVMCEAPACNCARVGRLALWFESLLLATGDFGYFTVYTSSKNDIVQVQKQLAAAEYFAAMAGKSLSSVPFIFGRYSKAISSPAFKKEQGKWIQTDKRTIIEKSLFELRIDPRWNQQTLLPAIREAAVLPPPAEDRPVTELRIADATKARALLGSGGTRRLGTDTIINGTTAMKDDLPLTIVTPPNPFGEMEMTPPDAGDGSDDDVLDNLKGAFDEGAAGTVEPPESDDEAETTNFISERVKYIGGATPYVLFAHPDGDNPARLYGRDLLRDQGPEFKTFADALEPGPNTQAPKSLPAPLIVFAQEIVSDSGYSYWKVTDLKRVEQDTAGEAKAS